MWISCESSYVNKLIFHSYTVYIIYRVSYNDIDKQTIIDRIDVNYLIQALWISLELKWFIYRIKHYSINKFKDES